MLNNKTLREEYIKRGKEKAKLFKWEKIADKTIIKVYLNIRGTKKENEPASDRIVSNIPSMQII